MGVTSKNLRYPEPTDEARLLHTRIKDLADDVNGILTTHDTRLASLDSKSDTNNTKTTANGLVLARTSGYIPPSVYMINDWVRRQPYYAGTIVVPSTARTALVSMSLAAHCNWNAALYWNPRVWTGNGWVSFFGGDTLSHNQGQPAIDLGFSCESIFDVRSGRSSTLLLSCEATVDAGSGGWIDGGYLHYNVTMLS